jgi:hypothetical protein
MPADQVNKQLERIQRTSSILLLLPGFDSFTRQISSRPNLGDLFEVNQKSYHDDVFAILGLAGQRPKICLVMTGCNGSAELCSSMQTHISVLPGERLAHLSFQPLCV